MTYTTIKQHKTDINQQSFNGHKYQMCAGQRLALSDQKVPSSTPLRRDLNICMTFFYT